MEQLRESIEEHKVNVEVLDIMTEESVKNLYKHLIKEVEKVLEENKWIN